VVSEPTISAGQSTHIAYCYSYAIIMVTKNNLDKAMADLKFQFDIQLAALRDHADLNVQRNDERMER
jgi:hypothetical protein